MNISAIVSVIFIISVIELVQVSHGKNIENLNPGFHENSKNVEVIESKALTDSSIYKAIKSMVNDQNIPVSTIKNTEGHKKSRVRRCALSILDNCRHLIENSGANAKDSHEHCHHCHCHVKNHNHAEPSHRVDKPTHKHCHHCHCHVKNHNHAEPSHRVDKPTYKHFHHCHYHVKHPEHHAEPSGQDVKHSHHCHYHVKHPDHHHSHSHDKPTHKHCHHCHCHDSDDHFDHWVSSASHQERKLERKKERCQKRIEYWKKKCESVK